MSLAAAIRREAVYLSHIVRTLLMLARIKPDSTRTIVDIVEARARATPEAPAIYYLDEVMSYGALDARANAYGHWAMAQGVEIGRLRGAVDGEPARIFSAAGWACSRPAFAWP